MIHAKRDRSTGATAVAVPSPTPRPLHNAALLSAASFAAKGCGFVALLVATRVLGTSGLGDYTAVMSFVGIFAVATDLGLTTLAVRDVAQDRAQLPRYLGNVLSLRLVLSIATAAACILVAITLSGRLHYGPTVRTGIVLWAAALVPIAVTGTMSLVFQAVERMAAISALTAATAAGSAIIGSIVLLLGGRVVAYVAVISGVNTVAALAALIMAARIAAPRPRVELRWWPGLVRAALPFAVLTLLNVLYSRADSLLVYSMKGAASAGLYAVTYRFVDTLLVLFISPFNAAALPAFNRIAAESREALRRLTGAGVRIMFAAGLPVAVAVTFYPRVILSIFGKPDYLVAAPALQWLAWSFPCFTVLAILYNALYAVFRAADVGRIFAITLVFNVAANVVLIPRFSYIASAAITSASELLNVILAGWCVRRHVGLSGDWTALLKVAAAGLAMAVAMYLLRPAGILAGLPAGLLAYLAVVKLSRALGEGERAIIARLPLAGGLAERLAVHGQ